MPREIGYIDVTTLRDSGRVYLNVRECAPDVTTDTDITTHNDVVAVVDSDDIAPTHAGCGGVVVGDADFIAGCDGGDEIWWNYRCTKCGETFQTMREYQTEE